MSNKYGYVGKDVPTQSFGSNKGVLNTDDLYELSNAGKLTQYGQLELIETKIASADSAVDFLDLGNYKTHLATVNAFTPATDSRHVIVRFSIDGGSSFIESGYREGQQAITDNGGRSNHRSDSQSFLCYLTSSIGNETNEGGNAAIRFYNLKDSASQSFSTQMNSDARYDGRNQSGYGASVYPQENEVNAIRFTGNAATTWTGSISLYGYKEYS
jgi:hypothetical protein